MSQGNAEHPSGDRRNVNLVRNIISGVTASLIVGLIFGYIALHNNTIRLTILAEQSEKRMGVVESDLRKNDAAYHELHLLIVKQNQILELLHKDMLEVKSEQKQMARGFQKDRQP